MKKNVVLKTNFSYCFSLFKTRKCYCFL